MFHLKDKCVGFISNNHWAGKLATMIYCDFYGDVLLFEHRGIFPFKDFKRCARIHSDTFYNVIDFLHSVYWTIVSIILDFNLNNKNSIMINRKKYYFHKYFNSFKIPSSTFRFCWSFILPMWSHFSDFNLWTCYVILIILHTLSHR